MECLLCSATYLIIFVELCSSQIWALSLSLQDLSHFVWLFWRMIDVCTHGHLFCCVLHFEKWYEWLLDEVYHVGKEDNLVGGNDASE